MTTPPPPPNQPSWPGSPSASTGPASSGRQPWWTGGRIAAAVVIVLVLMGGAGVAGFLAGVAVGSVDAIFDETDGFSGFDDEGFEVPGVTPLDTETVIGPPLRRGGATPGQLAGAPVDHELGVETAGRVVVTVTSPDFDTVLVLLDDTGSVVASDDDGADAGTDSLLDLDLARGTYTVRVQSWGGSGTGTYSVTVD